MFGKSAAKFAADAACCLASRATGIPIARPYEPAAEARFGDLRVVAVWPFEVPAFWASHPRAVTEIEALTELGRVTARPGDPEAARLTALNVIDLFRRLRREHPACAVFLVHDRPAVG